MNFDKIVVTITQLEGGVYLVACQGVIDERLGDGSELDDLGEAIEIYNEQVIELGQQRCDTKSQVIDFFVKKVEEV